MPIPTVRSLWKALYRTQHLTAQIPQTCALCGRWPQPAICPECLSACARPLPRCPRCALPAPERHGADGQRLPCGRCLRQPPPWQSATALFAYAYPWSWLIRRWKFQEESHWARWMALQLQSHPSLSSLLEQADWVVPLASHPQRVRERGYDPVAQLARCWAPADRRLDALIPPPLAPTQHRLSRRERLRQTQGWSCRPEAVAQLCDRSVLLLDDVLTTGATANAATQALLQAGARAVHLVVVARTD